MTNVNRVRRDSSARSSLRVPSLLHVFHSFGCGGAQTRFVRLANYFGPRLRHTVIAMNGDYSGMDLLGPQTVVANYPLQTSNGPILRKLPGMVRVLSEINPDYLVTHNWGTIEWVMAKSFHPTRHIHIEDGFGPDEVENLKLRRTLARRFLLRRSEVIVPSATLSRIARTHWKIDGKKLHFIPNGIDCNRFCRTPSQQPEISPQDDVPIVGAVAALRGEKNFARLLRAFAQVCREKPCKLIIVGGGPERTNLEALSIKLDLQGKVSFMGHVDNPAPLYRTFNAFVLTSDTEQMPYTVLEAMAAGLPVVATDVGDIRSMVSQQNASLIVKRDDGEISAAILRVLQDQDLARRAGEANERKVRLEYDQIAMCEAFADIYGLSSTPKNCS